VFPAQGDALSRFCSATLSAPRQFESRRSGRGYDGRIYFANEENANEGRAFGVLEDGTTRQLPRLGLFSWENTVPAYNRSDTTMTIGTEDTAFGQLRIYEGVKRSRGNPFDRAGLTNGVTSVLDLVDETVRTDPQFRAKYGVGTPVEFGLAEVDWDQSGLRQQVEAAADGLTLNRIEDGAWDPKHPDVFYFVTTEGGDRTRTDPAIPRDGGGLWKLTFEDIEHPRLGGTIELLLDGKEAPYLNKPDNVALDRHGNLLIQEDAGNSAHVSRIVAYDTRSGARGVVATFDPEQFAPQGSRFITVNEESSGIVDARHAIGEGWFLFTAMVHAPAADPDHVELGQLLAMKVDDFDEVYDPQ
jgi:secreted PhoX family phosphatase